MEIKLTTEESEDIFHTALCNGLEYVESSYGLAVDYSDEDYKEAKESLKKDRPGVSICYEDILLEMLRLGSTIFIVDEEGGDGDRYSITLVEVHQRVSKTPTKHLMDMINEEDDAETADVIIQQVFFNDVIYG